ncbi:unnamed protein product, partial [Heterosigma akashiwo]
HHAAARLPGGEPARAAAGGLPLGAGLRGRARRRVRALPARELQLPHGRAAQRRAQHRGHGGVQPGGLRLC